MSWLESTLRQRGLVPYRRAYFDTTREHISELRVVQERLSSFSGAGWICFCSSVEEHAPGDPVDEIPLSAELSNGSSSLHLRQADAGWALTTITEVSAGPDGEQYWIERTEHACVGGGNLHYDTAWRLSPGDVWRPSLSRFVERSR